ncbi:hypothetical protein MNBD_GAMMA12-2766 [hydrothermal vent metagenome]|uniref:Thioredoxin domain-containing protein n=1 Tax=hydrothermal vent metagenome TaxID=652676 RepID=A0A3B0Z4E3_9ZZZZ
MSKKLITKDKTFALILVLISILLIWLWLSPSGAQSAPEITVTTLSGKKITLGKSNQRPVLVTFWATSCSTCISEVPHLKKLYAKLKSKGFQLIGVAMLYDRPDLVVNMVKQLNINYPVVFDINGKIFKAFKLKRKLTPTSILIAPNNRIVMLKIGRMNIHAIEQTIQKMLTNTKKTI